MLEPSHDISTLNRLIAITIDSVDGYRKAAEETTHVGFAGLFTNRANEREDVARQLQEAVRNLGGSPADDGTILANAHRVFLSLKATLTGQDEKAIINEIEAGEDHIKATFEDALRDVKLSASTLSIVERCFAAVKKGHDEMRDLKHSM